RDGGGHFVPDEYETEGLISASRLEERRSDRRRCRPGEGRDPQLLKRTRDSQPTPIEIMRSGEHIAGQIEAKRVISRGNLEVPKRRAQHTAELDVTVSQARSKTKGIAGRLYLDRSAMRVDQRRAASLHMKHLGGEIAGKRQCQERKD